MRKILFATLLCFSFNTISVGADYPNNGIAYYLDFSIDLYTALHEEDMEEEGCLFIVKRSDFLKSFINDKNDKNLAKYYSHTDVRAKVIFQRELPYFIATSGIVRHGDDYYRLNKELFTKALENLSCPPVFD